MAAVIEQATPRGFLEWAVRQETDDCILWPFATTPQGYGSIRLGGRKGVSRGVHVVVLERRAGPCPSAMEAAHSPVNCHNRLCVNYRHLRWASRRENVADTLFDGTRNHGERNGQARLANVDVAGIIQRWGAGETQRTIAEHYGVSQPTVSLIVNGEVWEQSWT